MNEKSRQEVITRAFFETGKDGWESLAEYAFKLERVILWQDKELRSVRGKRGAIRGDIHTVSRVIRQLEEQKQL